MMLKKLFLCSAVLFTSLSAPALASNTNPDLLRVALLPDENSATVIQNNQGLQAYLETKLGKKVELVVTTDYSSMIEAARFGRIDVAYFGPASYTIAKDRMKGKEIDIEPFAARLKDGQTTYQAVVIANADSGIKTYADIKAKNPQVAFGDQASTSSHFAPKYTMINQGVNPSDYQQNFVGAHDAVARNVEIGNAQVGGLSRPIFESMLAKGTVKPDSFVIIGYSDPIPQYPWVMRTNLDPALKQQIKQAFYDLKLDSPEGLSVLKPFKADGFTPINDADYDIIRNIRKSVQ